MDPLLPVGEPGRKKGADTDHDVPQRHHAERHRSHVGWVCLCPSLQQYIMYVVQQFSAGPNNTRCIRTGMKNGTKSPV